MREQTIKYFTKEYQLLKDYENHFKKYKSLGEMRKSKIKGAEDLAVAIGLLTHEELNQLKADILQDEGHL